MQTSPILPEREEQLGILTDLLDRARAGNGAVAVITGPVGVGKTELLYRFADHATTTAVRVLSAVATRAERELPLGVLGQLLASPALPPDLAQRATQLLDDIHATWAGPLERNAERSSTFLSGLCAPLLELGRRSPLLLTVDDAHFTDRATLHCLSYFSRRILSARILIVLTESTQLSPASALLQAELLRDRVVRKVPLPPLTVDGVAEVLNAHDGGTAGQADVYWELTGGNPLLLRALMEDARLATNPPSDGVPDGERFTEAVLTCLYRSESATRRVAQALAVADADADTSILSRMLNLDAQTVTRAVHLLDQARLLRDRTFRHPRARAAVLASMAPHARGALQARAAGLLHHDGKPASAVARHLIDAAPIEESWVVPVLQEAAERAITDHDLEHASVCLRKALALDPDQRQRAEIHASKVRIKWHSNPADALRHLPELITAVGDGRLTGQHALHLVNYLLWHGRIDQVWDLLPLLRPHLDNDTRARSHLDSTLTAAARSFPEHAGRLMDERPDPQAPPEEPAGSPLVGHGQLAHLSAAFYICGPAMAAGSAGWRGSVRRADTSELPVGRILVQAVRAEQALRRGDLLTAVHHAERGLAALPPTGWGIVIGCLLSTLIRAHCAAGDYEAAARYLEVPVPPGMFSTSFGLEYLYARGKYFLAVERLHTSLNDLRACGERMVAWGLDCPDFLPWRTDLAEAYLRLGQPHQSERLVLDQMRRLQGEQPRPRAMSLRMLAATVQPRERIPLLEEAIGLSGAAGDRLETVYALADLGLTFDQLGELGPAHQVMGTARHLAQKLGAKPILDLTVGWRPAADDPPPADHPADPPLPMVLSNAELRVAALAAQGHPNRAIAAKLYLTVSTVEQHLTRVYRKLRVYRRTQLPSWLRQRQLD